MGFQLFFVIHVYTYSCCSLCCYFCTAAVGRLGELSAAVARACGAPGTLLVQGLGRVAATGTVTETGAATVTKARGTAAAVT